MRTHATFRIGLAMAAGTIVAGCANGVASPGPSVSAAPPSLSPSSDVASPGVASPGAIPSPTNGGGSSGSNSPGALPTITLTEKPPREPTDTEPSTGWVAGMVTRGGTGPCYGLIADDGKRYALYSTGGVTLTKGDRVKAHLETTMLRIYCGPGTLMAMTDVEQIK